MFTDIVGYTTKIGENKKVTLALLTKYKENVEIIEMSKIKISPPWCLLQVTPGITISRWSLTEDPKAGEFNSN